MVIYINKQWEVFQNTQLDLKILFKKNKTTPKNSKTAQKQNNQNVNIRPTTRQKSHSHRNLRIQRTLQNKNSLETQIDG